MITDLEIERQRNLVKRMDRDALKLKRDAEKYAEMPDTALNRDRYQRALHAAEEAREETRVERGKLIRMVREKRSGQLGSLNPHRMREDVGGTMRRRSR